MGQNMQEMTVTQEEMGRKPAEYAEVAQQAEVETELILKNLKYD
jgi:hypothetical protein